MSQGSRFRSTFFLALLVTGLVANVGAAAPFNKTRELNGTYLMGTSSIQEFDQWVALYPDYAAEFGFTFKKNGTVTIYDEQSPTTESGTYVRNGPGNRITVTLTSAQSPWGPVTYELYRVGNTNQWWGEVRINGSVWGHFRGTLAP